MKHGASGYSKGRCRCDVCVKANSAHKRAWRERNRPTAYPPHRAARQWPLQALCDVVADPRDLIGASWNQWTSALERGLSDRTADQWAVKCGIHPGEVWSDWFTRGLHPSDDVFIHGTATAVPGWRAAYEYQEAG